MKSAAPKSGKFKKKRRAGERKATDADVCYTVINCYLDGNLNGLERSDDLNPILIEALQKIAALKLAVKVACEVWNMIDDNDDEEPLDQAWLEQVCRDRVLEVAREKRPKK